MLSDFFRINFPYGISRTKDNEWFAFNREYLPLGWNDTEKKSTFHIEEKYDYLPIYTKYKNLTDKFLKNLVDNSENSIKYDDEGKIITVWLYKDNTNPMNQDSIHNKYWKIYFDRLKKLSKIMKKE